MTRTRFLHLLKISISVLVILVVVGYAAWRSLPYARGPVIQIFQPLSGTSSNEKTIEIVGRADRVNALTLNGNQISIDEKGNFRETIALFRGLNVITLRATDQFGRAESDQIEILGL